MGLIEAIGEGDIAVDACILIYFLEQHAKFAPSLNPLFEQAAEGKRVLVSSILSLLEVGVGPLRDRRIGLWQLYEHRLSHSRELRLVAIDLRILRSATMIRAKDRRIKTPDALQLASAMVTGCKAFLTNDKRIRSLPGLRVIQLTDYL